MGMELSSNWVCDRCAATDSCKVGQIPSGWSAIGTPAGIILDKELNPDMNMNFKKLIICNTCTTEYRIWAGLIKQEGVVGVALESGKEDDVVPVELGEVRVASVTEGNAISVSASLSDKTIEDLESDIK